MRLRATCLSMATIVALGGTSVAVAVEPPSPGHAVVTNFERTEVRRPVGPRDLPESLPGGWIVSLCLSERHGHAWIRFENAETGEVRTISRFHLLVGGWFDARHLHWNYAPTFKTGLHMDREQSLEDELAEGEGNVALLSARVDDPVIYRGDDVRGHGIVRDNCVTYTRDAWYAHTGEYFDLPVVHTPQQLRKAIEVAHPELWEPVQGGPLARRWAAFIGKRPARRPESIANESLSPEMMPIRRVGFDAR